MVAPGRVAALALAAGLVAFAFAPGTAAAASRTGGTVVVPAGESVGELTAIGGVVVVRGEVRGDLEAYGAAVVVSGRVGGDVVTYGGAIRLDGEVGGSVTAFGASMVVGEAALIRGRLETAAASAVIAGRLEDGLGVASAGTLLASSAEIAGGVAYDGSLTNHGAVVNGGVRSAGDASVEGPTRLPTVPRWVAWLVGVLAKLAVGAVALAAGPSRLRGLARRFSAQPFGTSVWGLGAIVVVLMGCVGLSRSMIGLPLAVVGLVGLAGWVWVGDVVGRYLIGRTVVSRVGGGGEGVALVVGVVGVAVVKLAWGVGALAEAAAVAVGVGAMASAGVASLEARVGGDSGK